MLASVVIVSLALEEKQLELWSKKLSELESTHCVLKHKVASLTELIESKEQQALQLEEVRANEPEKSKELVGGVDSLRNHELNIYS